MKFADKGKKDVQRPVCRDGIQNYRSLRSHGHYGSVPCFDGMLPAGPLSLADQRVYADPACADPDHECISVLRAVTNAAGMAAFVLFSSYLEV